MLSLSFLSLSLSLGDDAQEILYGTQNGKIGLVKLTPLEPCYRWDMLNERKHGGITCLSTFDLTGDGLPDIIVGRDDGVVEVYGLDDSDEPRLKFTHVRQNSCHWVILFFLREFLAHPEGMTTCKHACRLECWIPPNYNGGPTMCACVCVWILHWHALLSVWSL